MYCYDGLYYQLISPGLIFLIGAVLLFYITRNTGETSNDESEKKRKTLHVVSILAIAFFLFIVGKVGYSIINPTVNAYTGQFDTYYRDSRSAPPLPFTYSYTFRDGEEAQSFNIDQFSIEKIYPKDLKKGKWYTVYYVKGASGQVIVRIDEGKPSG